jgi:RNA polymerase sigma-70 factor, ECF subfamily
MIPHRPRLGGQLRYGAYTACQANGTWRAVYGQGKGVLAMGTTVADSLQEVAVGAHQNKIQELTTVFASHLPSFSRMALCRLGNVADAEDAVQDAFLSAYTHLNQFKGQAQMSTWLTTIVINSARMKVRRRSQQLHIPLDGQDPEQDHHTFSETLSDHRPSPEEICRRWEFAERLAQFSTRLSPTLRRTFQLREVDGLSIRETAQALGVRDSTVKARAARARANLKQLVQESAGGKCGAI